MPKLLVVAKLIAYLYVFCIGSVSVLSGVLFSMVAEKVVFGFLIADSPFRIHVYIRSIFPLLIAYSRCG